MTKDELRTRILNACDELQAAEQELTDIDAKFGDADHGLTMRKVAIAIRGAAETSDGSIKEMLDDIAMAVMVLNGGSAIPLWNTWLDGMQEAAPDKDEIDMEEIKQIFANALEEFEDMSGASIGDKTMMDALAPASAAIAEYDGEEQGIWEYAAAAAAAGAEATRNYVAKFGRAKSYGDKTIGTADAGASSMAYFFKGLAK